MYYQLNFVLCVIIILLGIWVYNKTSNRIAIYIISAFSLFGLSHFASILGVSRSHAGVFSFLRSIGYILMIVALIMESIGSTKKDI